MRTIVAASRSFRQLPQHTSVAYAPPPRCRRSAIAANVIIQCQRSNPAKAPGISCGAAHSRGVAQPGRAPGSGPGGRRFKSSLPDQSFQAHKLRFWFFVYIDGVEIVDGRVFLDFPLGFHRALQSDFPARISPRSFDENFNHASLTIPTVD